MPGRITRKLEIALFDSFRSAIESTFKNYPYLFDVKKAKTAFAHRLASEFDKITANQYLVDINLPLVVGASSIPEIIIRERNFSPVMAIFIEEDYLSNLKKEEASKLHEETGAFTIALSLLREKDYLLVYRFASTFTDYLHLSKHDYSESLLKRMEDAGPDEQLLLIPNKRKRKKKTQEIV